MDKENLQKDLNSVSGGIKEGLAKLREEKERKLISREDSWKKWDNLFKNNN